MEFQIGMIFISFFFFNFHIALGSALPTQLQILSVHLVAKIFVYAKEAYKSNSFNREMCALLVCYAAYGDNSLPTFRDGNYYPGTNDIIGADVPCGVITLWRCSLTIGTFLFWFVPVRMIYQPQVKLLAVTLLVTLWTW